jgi:hypothetical protein
MGLQSYRLQRCRQAATGFVAGAAVAALVSVVVVPMSAHATQPDPTHKVTLCHATDSYTNPYVEITVDVAAVLNGGHGNHVGPVFDPTLTSQPKWGDIIPAFDLGPGEQYPGMNLTPDGQAILDAGCQVTTTSTTMGGGGGG